jgi:hypothetical protein
MGLRRMTNTYSPTRTCTKPNNKLVSALLGHFWCQDKPRANLDSQDSPRPRLGGSHHLPPYIILCASPWSPHPNGFLSWDSQMGVSKLPKLGLSRLWGPITLYENLWWKWGLKQSCSPRRELFNHMLHVTCTQGNRVDFWFLMVRSQIANLTPDLSFGHNLWFRCPNGSCELTLDI